MTMEGFEKRRNSYNSVKQNTNKEKKKMDLWKVILIWTCIILIGLCLLIFILIWVVLPITFWLSIAFQKFMIFIPLNNPKNPTFEEPEAYNISGVHNFYITVKDLYDNSTKTQIGTWLVLHEDDVGKTTTTNIKEIIRDTDKDILLYLHGVYANRAQPIDQYKVFRKHWLIIAMDHRGYGDSGQNVVMSEEAIVNDNIEIYDWLKSINSRSDIYYWGHSLGTGITSHSLKALREQRDFVPKGLVLESAFTNIFDVIANTGLGKLFTWLAYYEATIPRPLDKNGIRFQSVINVISIDCPIMLFHAKDDNVVAYKLGEELYKVASGQRDPSRQGQAIFHGFDASKGYGHVGCTRDPMVPQYIEEFKQLCNNFTLPKERQI